MLVNAIWDFDGTLYDSYPGMMKALAALVTANGGQIKPKTLYRQVKETSIKQFLTGFGQQVGRSVVDLRGGLSSAGAAIFRIFIHILKRWPY